MIILFGDLIRMFGNSNFTGLSEKDDTTKTTVNGKTIFLTVLAAPPARNSVSS